MKILYGVQGTGNGHLSRARAMAAALGERDIGVDYLFSGRLASRYFDMECFADYKLREGFTLVNEGGRVNHRQTVVAANCRQFLRDVWSLDLAEYDLVLSDFEPISAWAGRLRRKTVISMGHQPAFDFAVPTAGRNFRSSLLMRLFAPGKVRVGMHWDSFGSPILPPLIDVLENAVCQQPRKVLVYLPFECQVQVKSILLNLNDYQFFVYAPGSDHCQQANLHLRPTSLAGFRHDLHDCTAVICNAGFELPSECLSLGKRLLVRPLAQQMEQASNALALQRLGFGSSLEELNLPQIRDWLAQRVAAPQVRFPNVAAAMTRWIEQGDFCQSSLAALSNELWAQVRVDNRAETQQLI